MNTNQINYEHSPFDTHKSNSMSLMQSINKKYIERFYTSITTSVY